MKKFCLTLLSLFSYTAFAQIQLHPLNLNAVGKIAQIEVNDKAELIAINQQNELWKISDTPIKLTENVSTHIAPYASNGRIALADKQGNFLQWDNGTIHRSQIPLAKNAGMLPLAFATIAVTQQKGHYKLVRIETQNNQAKIVATAAMPILPDAHPMQIDFQNPQANQGHIAVLAKPDNKTYQHGVLGDDIEALEVHYLERHTLEPLAEKLTIDGLVFEANRFEHLSAEKGAKLVSVMSGNGEGGRTVLIGMEKGKLVVESQSNPLPNNRWQSPFVFNHKLYAVQMPHLRGKLVEYTSKGSKLTEHFIQDGLSNHAYGEYETNLAANTQDFALIPKRNYRQVAILDKQGKLDDVDTQLPAPIIKTRADKQRVYLLLNDGQVWIAEKNPK